MYSLDYIDDQVPPISYFMAPVRVYLVKSTVYSAQAFDCSYTNAEECGQEFALTLPIYDNSVGIPLGILVKELSKHAQIDFCNYQILYRLPKFAMYVLAGVFPFEEEPEYIQIEDFMEPIFIKFRIASRVKKPLPNLEEEKKIKVRRGNERRIGEVIDALMQWKRLFMLGAPNENGAVMKYTRQEAARVVQIPKKTLDDYASQIKQARERGFDFDLHCKEKFGVLREFNRHTKPRVATC